MPEPLWYLSKDGDLTLLALYERHYSCYEYKDGRERTQFVGPGECIVLRTGVGDAGFVWRKFIDDSGQEGVNCAFFRNESEETSSELVRQADAIADLVWPGERHYTYVDPEAVRSTNPGYCFIAAGWRRCGWTKGGKLILERVADSTLQSDTCITALMPNQLYLPDWFVTDTKVDRDGAYQIAATYDVPPEACLKCGVVGQLYKHGAKAITYVDAPVHGRQTFINVRRGRYRCRECGGTFMQPLPDMDDERRMTLRCREYIQAQCLLKPNTHVAEDVGIDEKVVRQIGRANAERLFAAHAEGIRAPRILGIDELFLGDEMRAIFVDIETSWPIEILRSRWQAPVTNFLCNLPGRHEVEVVTTDMWKPYKVAVQHAMPQAVLIVDKWHVMRMANDVMDVARRRYQGLLTQKDRKALKARKAAFLKRPFKLSPREQLDLDGWLKNTPELRGAYETKEAFMDIWRHRKRELAKAALDEWRGSIPPHLQGLFRPVLTATRNWETEILNYFDNGRFTNAPTEARNRVIKMINRLGAGYSFDAIRARALFGKRPGRIKAERAAAEAARMAALIECSVCKALFPKPGVDARHIVPTVPSGVVQNGVPLCDMCLRFHTRTWFNHGSTSTSKSE